MSGPKSSFRAKAPQVFCHTEQSGVFTRGCSDATRRSCSQDGPHHPLAASGRILCPPAGCLIGLSFVKSFGFILVPFYGLQGQSYHASVPKARTLKHQMDKNSEKLLQIQFRKAGLGPVTRTERMIVELFSFSSAKTAIHFSLFLFLYSVLFYTLVLNKFLFFMKKFIITLCLFCGFSYLNASSQTYFTLTPEGFKANDDKDYIVITVDNQSSNDLLTSVKNSIQNILPVDNDNSWIVNQNQILISSYKLNLFRMNAAPLTQYVMDLDYTIKFTFKDGRYKIDAPIIKNIGVHRFMLSRMVVYANPKDYKNFKKKQFIFDYNNRSISNEEAKNAIEKYINTILNQIINSAASKSPDNDEDW